MLLFLAEINTTIIYTKKDKLFEEEKPYYMRYRQPGFPSTNIEPNQVEVGIRDLRGAPPVTMEKEGFELLPSKSQMEYEDYFDDSMVTGTYFQELSRLLEQRFGATRTEFVRHNVSTRVSLTTQVWCLTGSPVQIRQRHATFPISSGSPYAYDQPAQMVHIGQYSIFNMKTETLFSQRSQISPPLGRRKLSVLCLEVSSNSRQDTAS